MPITEGRKKAKIADNFKTGARATDSGCNPTIYTIIKIISHDKSTYK